MPRLVEATPKYRRHKASGQAIVSIQGRDYYLGPWNSKASKVEYDRIISEWLAAGRRLPATLDGEADLTVVEVLARYKKFALEHYRKDGAPTRAWSNIEDAIAPLRRLYDRTQVREFGPLALKAIQRAMIASGLSRGVINSRIGTIKRIFRWAVSEQLAPPSVVVALDTVMGLQRGRTAARETVPVPPVDDQVVEKTLACLPEVVADMVRFQRLTGCRPGEVCQLRPMDLDRSIAVWSYRPATHKTEYRGRERIIFIGPKAQAVIRPYLLREATATCFSPEESEAERHAEMRERRKTKVQPSQQNRRKSRRVRAPERKYTKDAYNRAIQRACEAAFNMPKELQRASRRLTPSQVRRLRDQGGESAIELAEEERQRFLKLAAAWRAENCWSPNQLRHAAGTEVRRKFGLEAAQVVLGHAKADVTQVYAERDMALAAAIMQKIG